MSKEYEENYAAITMQMLGLDIIIIDILNEHAIYSLEDLINSSQYELREMKGIGKKRYDNIIEAMSRHNVAPRRKFPEHSVGSAKNYVAELNGRLEDLQNGHIIPHGVIKYDETRYVLRIVHKFSDKKGFFRSDEHVLSRKWKLTGKIVRATKLLDEDAKYIIDHYPVPAEFVVYRVEKNKLIKDTVNSWFDSEKENH